MTLMKGINEMRKRTEQSGEQAGQRKKQFNLVIDEEPLDNACHVWSRIILLKNMAVPNPEGKEGQMSPTPGRCSPGCLKYRQCVLEECERDIQHRPIP
ncbi:hypothetical protein TNCV_3257691 [Trichonephila clavipes]|nr:hypothetical protein TNCV_3257691 [Trichonephila clavipes]